MFQFKLRIKLGDKPSGFKAITNKSETSNEYNLASIIILKPICSLMAKVIT